MTKNGETAQCAQVVGCGCLKDNRQGQRLDPFLPYIRGYADAVAAWFSAGLLFTENNSSIDNMVYSYSYNTIITIIQ